MKFRYWDEASPYFYCSAQADRWKPTSETDCGAALRKVMNFCVDRWRAAPVSPLLYYIL